MANMNKMNRYIQMSSVKTATFSTTDIDTEDLVEGIMLFVDVTAVSWTIPTLLVQIESKDPVSGKYVLVPWAITASIVATWTYVLSLRNGITAVANSLISYPMPTLFRLTCTIGWTTPSFTFSIGAQLTY